MNKAGITHTYKSSPLNSTDFTACCSVAVLRYDSECPKCRKLVLSSDPVRPKTCLMCGKPRTACYC
jgi:hypothetical protein